MAFRRSGRYGGENRFGVSFIEASLALSVIVGLLFVTLRVLAMPELSGTQAAHQQPVSRTDSDVVTTMTSALESDQSAPKTP